MKTIRFISKFAPDCFKHGFYLAVWVAALVFAPALQAQLAWSSYNNVGTLVTTNVASGGDSTYGGSVTFTIPATTQYIFLTKTFKPVSIAAASSSSKTYFTMNASGGLVASARELGMGLLNDVGVTTELHDTGYWVDFNSGNPSFELFDRPSTVTTFFQYDSTDKLGSGKTATGSPSNGNTYGMQFQLNMNSSANSVSIGTSASSYATGGSCMTNITGTLGTVNEISYSSGVSTATLPTTTFNEFAFEFNNTASSSVTVTLAGVTLVPANPVITTQPSPYSGHPGDNVTFSIALNANSDTSTATYQWYSVVGTTTNTVSNGAGLSGSSTISGATTASMTITGAQIADNANYYVVVNNNYGSATSSQATLNIASSATPPAITAISATNVTLILSNSVAIYSTNIVVTATGSPLPNYYWTNNSGTQIQSGSSATLTLGTLALTAAGTYSVTASNSAGVASTNFTVNVYAIPTISSQPAGVLLNVGNTATFSVTSTDGSPTPSYQWYKNGVAISGATATNYVISSVALTDIANYSVTISNIAGQVTSTNAKLAIYSTMTGTPASPTNGATGVCYDTPLSINFSSTPSVGSVGKVYIYNTASPSTPVDTLDMSQGSPQARTIGGVTINSYPIIITGNTAVIYPHSGVMTSNQSYYVTMDPGVIVDSSGAYFTGISGSSTWAFSTKAGGPVNSTNFIVAANGTGDFCTVQGACDAVPSGNSSRLLINIQNGTYTEIVRLNSKSDVTFIGQDRTNTLIKYPNWNGINGSSSTRPLFGVLGANDVAIENLTISNSTPNSSGNNQAEALYVNSAKRFIMLSCNLDSYQDTLLVNASGDTAYVQDSHVQGNTDFMWGEGTLYATNDQLMCMPFQSAQDYMTQVRTLQFTNGFAYVNCRIDGANSGVTNCYLGRDASGSGFPYGNCAYISCTMDTNVIVPAGWALGSSTVVGSGATGTSNLRLWEYQSVDLTGYPVPTGSRASWSQQISSVTAASVANVTNWLYTWQPQLTPYIVTQPANQSAGGGLTATFSVTAIAIPAPAYQWQTNGVNVLNATNATLSVSNVSLSMAGTAVTVIVTNASGVVTSSVANLSYTQPVAGAATFTRAPGLSLKIAVADLLTNVNDPGVTLMLAGVGTDGYNLTTTNGVNLSTNSTFIFYTNSTPGNVNDSFDYVVADGYGGLSTNTVTVDVVSVTGQQTSVPVILTSSNATLVFYGVPGTNYDVERATNLTPPVTWVDLGTTSAPPGRVFQVIDNFTDLNSNAPPQAYWQLIINP